MNGVELQIWEQRELDKRQDWLRELLRDVELIIAVRFIRSVRLSSIEKLLNASL